ncbi:Phosphoserine phosphatase RsbU [Poriferisphaera corsica]|uniref:Phosphoserine phosphatase RsbU n=1 Tax=Poriferisphaera corsica TaxID=2528020 RepID=A0A517YPC5_9BACT|nr:SpoIIE family protein phosphatase [Poriferisphaera corsica]QDU32066.1 Phosphoserine phosphatase RsbU [Poriferisphaera corsica]
MNDFESQNITGDSLSTASLLETVTEGAVERAGGLLSLRDFLDLNLLQEIQDSFTAVTRLSARVVDEDGDPVTAETKRDERDASNIALAHLIGPEDMEEGFLRAPIIVEGKALGSIMVEPETTDCQRDPKCIEKFRSLACRLGVEHNKLDGLMNAFDQSFGASRAASIQLLYLLANAIARLCYEEYQSRLRAEELSVLYEVSRSLAVSRDLQQVLDKAAKLIAEVMKVKAVGIRLLEKNKDASEDLVPKAIYNLSPHYLQRGTIRLDTCNMFGEVIEGDDIYVRDMLDDDRVMYPGDAAAEGLRSMLCVGLVYQNKAVGTLQLFTGNLREFSQYEIRLARAIAQLLATSVETARLEEQRKKGKEMMRQVQLAASVQRRMLPKREPDVDPFDVAARYVPSMELAGDFYDYILLDNNLGISIGDVVGKGVAAALLMASAKASIRAYAQDLYDIDEIMQRVNEALIRDTLTSEFATIWYGVLDPKHMRLTYCNGGHEPPILIRKGAIHQLDVGGMLVGVMPGHPYEKGLWDLESGDIIMLYTDGLLDAFNTDGEKFGRQRAMNALLTASREKQNASEMLNHVLWEMRQFTGIHRATDDTTVVVVRVK